MSTFVWCDLIGVAMFLTWLVSYSLIKHPSIPEPVVLPLVCHADIKITSINGSTVGLAVAGADAAVWPAPTHLVKGDTIRMTITAKGHRQVPETVDWIKGKFVAGSAS